MIYDCFLYSYEEDALEVRLRELETIADLTHVALMATTDLRGRPAQWEVPGSRFDPWRRRLSVFVLEIPQKELGEPMTAERWLRDQLPHYADLIGCRQHDFVIVSDCDEVPDSEQLKAAIELTIANGFATTLFTDYRELKADWRAPDHAQPPHQAYVALREAIVSAQALRTDTPPTVRAPGRGWHLSSMGGPEVVRRKLSTFSHSLEIDPRFLSVEWLEDCTRRGRDLLNRFDLEPIERTVGSLPASVLEQPRLSHLLRDLT